MDALVHVVQRDPLAGLPQLGHGVEGFEGEGMGRFRVALFVGLALAGCSKGAAPNEAAKPTSGPVTPSAAPTSQIAYTYSFGFKLPAGRMAELQTRHLALCDRLGPRCHVVSMDQADGRRNATAGMEVAVAADMARAFGDALVAAAKDSDAAVADRTIQGEDLSKRIVDVEARLRGRQALADRLLGIVQSHSGSVGDLVAAEKALADVQEEIDTARSELADAKGRVAMSTVRIGYTASAGLGGFAAPIGDSFSSVGSVAGMSVGVLVSFLAAVLPWLIPAVLIVAGFRWWRRRRDAEAE
jgi:hypothetical protein